MKTTAFAALAAIVSLALPAPRAAAQDYPDQFENHYYAVPGTARIMASDTVPWSVLGQWHYAGPAWRGMIELRADGTFSRAGDGQAGKWKLSAAEDQFVLILKWDHSPQETVAFIGPTLFQGETAKGEDILVRRLPVVAGS